MNPDDIDIFGYNLGGSVSEMMRNPKLERQPMMTEEQAAYFAAQMLPGAASIDAVGEMAAYDPVDIFAEKNNPSFIENVRQGKIIDPALQALGVLGDATYAAGPLVGGLLGSALKAPGALSKASKLKAFHGSPHNFDAFSTANIGTGEGAQAYGRGLYFAEREATAKGYRDQLKANQVIRDDGVEMAYGKHLTEVETAIKKQFPNLDPDNLRTTAKSVVDDNLVPADVEGMGVFDSTGYKAEDIYLSGIKANKNATASKGHMYEVAIDANVDELLDFDLPLVEQKKLLSKLDDVYGDHEIVLKQLGIDIRDNPGGVDLIDALSMRKGNQLDTPPLLKDIGIKGIQYTDALTRFSSGQKTKNYVIFDERLIEISKKYGIAIPVAAVLLEQSMTEAQDEPIGMNLGGSVSQMMRDPDEERAAGPTGPQAASFAMNLPPGAGLTDAFGYMPQLPGSEAGYEDIFDQPNYPSMAANIGQGDYLDAGFQGLGVLGDLATAVPLVGPALGAAIKTPGALRKANKGIAPLLRQYDERFDPRVGEIDRLNNLNYDIAARAGTNNPDALKLSDLEGEDFVTSMSDRTRAGGVILGIDGVPLYRGIDLRGGQGFMFENPNQVWASAEVPSRKILEMAEEMKRKSGKDPLFLPWRMAPTGGDFSSITGELMLGFASANMGKKTKKALDEAISKYKTKGSIKTDKKTGIKKRVNANLQIKGWKGVDDPSSVEIWKNTPDVVRKELMNMMDVSFRNQGGLSIGAARLINTDPPQVNAIDAGFQNVGRIAADQKIMTSTHPAYPFAVPGEGIGSLPNADNATIFELLPDARYGDKQKKVADAANPTAREIRALQMKPYGGTITENILRRMEERGVNINSLTGLAPGALAFTLISGSLITPEEAAAGGLEEVAEELSSENKTGVKKRFSPDNLGTSFAAGGMVSGDLIDIFDV